MVNNSSSTPSPLLTPYTTTPIVTTAASSPSASTLYSKYRIRKRNDPSGSGTEKGDGPSEIVQTVLSKSSIFDQDSKRLGQTDESIENKDLTSTNENSPKSYSAWSKTDIKENPMVTVPGSLLDRLGQGSNGSFPTLTVNTTFPSATNVSMNKTDSMNSSLYSYDNRAAKLSPLPCLDIPSVNDKNSLTVSASVLDDNLLQKVDSSEKSPRLERNGLSGSDLDLTKSEIEKSPVLPKSILKNRSDSDLSLSNSFVEKDNNDIQSSSSVDNKFENCIKENKMDLNDKSELIKIEKKDNTDDNFSKLVKSSNVNGETKDIKEEKIDEVKELNKSGAKKEEVNSYKDIVSQTSVDKHKYESAVNDTVKIESKHISNSESSVIQDIKCDAGNVHHMDKVKEESPADSKKSESDIEMKTVKQEVKMEVETSTEIKKSEQKSQSSKTPDKEKHSSKDSSKSAKDNTFKEPSHKKQKVSKDSKDKKSDSSHKDEKHKKKESEKKGESSHKSSSDKKDDKHKHKSKSDKDKKDGDKKSKDKEEKKESKEEKKKKVEKKEKKDDKNEKEGKDDKSEKHSKEKTHNKDSENKDNKEKSSEKKEKSEKKHEKKEGHKHEKHLKSPDKKSKSAHKEEESKDKSKEASQKESTPKEGSSKDVEKDKVDKEKTEKKGESSKKEHKSSSHKTKKSKDESSKKAKDESSESKLGKEETTESKKNKDEESKKVKDDHSEHKKKDESNNRNNKDSPDKNKDANRKESSEKKSTEKTKDKSGSGEKCKEDKSKNKEKENKDKDPDHTKSKSSKPQSSSSTADSSDKPKSQSSEAKVEKPKAENEKEENKRSENKEDKKSKDVEMNKNSFSLKKFTKESDSHKKNPKPEKSSKNKSEPKKECKKSVEAECKNKRETPKKKDKEHPMYNGLTEEDLAIFAQFADESSLSMYAKVKRRSTEKKLHIDKEHEEQKKLISEYKRNQKNNKKHSLSDITESSEVSSDDNRRKSSSGQKNKKKFAFSSDDSDSSTDTGADILHKKNKAKMQTKKPKRILDIYSSDSEEEEMSTKTPSKKSSSGKKKKLDVHRELENKFEFDSISDSDNKTSATKQAKVKTKTKTNKKPSKSKTESKSQSKNEKKDVKPKKPKIQRKDLSFKDLFSDDSDDSMDSDSDSDIMMTSKSKKKPFFNKNDKNKKKLPRGSSIYTSSEESDSNSDDEFKPMSPPKSTVLPKKTESKKISPFKDHDSDSFNSDIEIKSEKNKKDIKNKLERKHDNSFDSDNSLLSDPELNKVNKIKTERSDNKISNKIDLEIFSSSDAERKFKKQKSKEKVEKDMHKFNNNKKIHDIITDDGRFDGLTKLEMAKVYSETVYEKDTLLSNLTNKDNLPPILADINKEPLYKLGMESVRNDIPNLKDITFDEKSGKIKNKKHKKENKKKKKNKEKPGKETSKEKVDSISNKSFETKPEIPSEIVNHTEHLKQDSDLENANAVNRNLFDEMKTMKSPEGKKPKMKKEKDASHNSKQVTEKEKPKFEPERLSDSDFVSDSEKRKSIQAEKLSVTNKKSDVKKSPNSDVFDFQEEESKIEPIKESHMKVMKPDLYDVKVASDHETDTSANVPVEIQSVEIEYTSEEHDYKDDGNVCPEVETTEVVIEEATEVKVEKEKPKPRKRKGRKNSGKEGLGDLTEEAVSSLSKESKNQGDIQTEVVPFEAPASNEQELVIDEGVSLHVEDETDKAVESIVNDVNDETAKAVESILLDGMPTYAISEPVEPTPELDTNYLQPEFAPGLPAAIPQVGTEVEATTANTPLKGKKGRKGKRTKSGQADALLNENSNKLPDGKPFDLLGDTTFAPDITSSLDQNDDDDDGRLQIDFDPPKPEAKQKKPRKPKQTKGNKMNDAAALAAENKLDNLFGNFNSRGQNKDELNRDSLSSESSELDRAKHEELLFMEREDQRHDSDMMSPDERSTSDDLTSPDVIKAKPKRGRKPKNKDPASVPIPRTNSPRATRTLSPRSPRSNFDPKSPEPKLNGPKNLIIDEGSKTSSNVFDFDDDESGSGKVGQIPTTTAPPLTTTTPAPKQRKPRQKKKVEPGLQSPENRSMFSSPEHSDKLVIGSPDSKGVFSPDHKVQYNAWDKKALFSPQFQPEEQKLEVKTAADDKPPEPLFKAFFEAKPKSEKDIDKTNPLLAKKGMFSPKEGENKTLTAAQIMSNVDKTIEDVSKGLFESTDDEATSISNETTPVQKKRQSRKSKEEDIKSPLKSPVPKSPMVKSPIVNHINSPPPSIPVPHQQPLVLPGMGIGQPTTPAQIGEPQLAGHVGMFGQMSPPVSIAACRAPGQANSAPEAAKSVEVPQKIQEKIVSHSSPVKTTVLQSPVKSSGITTVVQSTSASTVMPSVSASVAQDLRKVDGAMEGVLKNAMPGFLVPGISASTAMNVVQGMTSAASTAHTTVISSTATPVVAAPAVTSASDIAKRQQTEKLVQQEQQMLEQHRIREQMLIEHKQAELQKQQEHHVKLKEMELKRHLEEQQKKLQELKNKELQEIKNKEEALKKEQEKKRLEEQYKLLQHHHQEQLKQLQATVGPGVPPLGQQALLSPGALSRPRPSLPSPNDGKTGQRPQISAHHAMPPGAFGLPVRPSQFPHLTQIQAMQQHLVQPLGQDKLPTNAELALKHQQLQQHIASQQKAQVQAMAEQQAQIAKQQATQAKQSSQQAAQGKQSSHSGPAKNSQATAGAKKGVELQRPPTSQGPGIPPLHSKEGAPLPGSQEAANQLTQQIKQQLAMQAQHNQGHPGSHGGPPQAPHGLPGWQMPHMRPEGPRQPGPQGPVTGEARTSMPGPVPVLGGNPQQVQRVSPNPPTKSPTVAQTAPNMVLGFSQHQTAAPRAPSPAVAKVTVFFIIKMPFFKTNFYFIFSMIKVPSL